MNNTPFQNCRYIGLRETLGGCLVSPLALRQGKLCQTCLTDIWFSCFKRPPVNGISQFFRRVRLLWHLTIPIMEHLSF